MARILVVEDDDSVRAFTTRALQAGGHAVDTAEDGEDGLDKIIRVAGTYDLVLSDIRMPMMDGIAMAKAAAASFPALRIILMTGYADQRERAVELERVVRTVVQKPFTLAEIRSRVDDVLMASA